MNFNTAPEAVVGRELLILYLNTGTTESPVWRPVGKRVEDSSAEYDWGEESKTDIFGKTYTTMRKPTITQSFEPCELDAGDEAQMRIWNLAIREQNVAALCNMDMLVVHAYAGAKDTGVFAERYSSCAIKPTSLGGSNNVGMPIEVTFGGDRITGTASVSNGVVTFTPDTENSGE